MNSEFNPGHVFTVASISASVEAQAQEIERMRRARAAVDAAKLATVRTLAVLAFRDAMRGRK